MAGCSVTEKDFTAVGHAAMELWKAGDQVTAIVLDELARKINGALSAASSKAWRVLGGNYGLKRPPIESPLEAAGMRPKQVKQVRDAAR